jgi:hypothetical protein
VRRVRRYARDESGRSTRRGFDVSEVTDYGIFSSAERCPKNCDGFHWTPDGAAVKSWKIRQEGNVKGIANILVASTADPSGYDVAVSSMGTCVARAWVGALQNMDETPNPTGSDVLIQLGEDLWNEAGCWRHD